MKYTSTFYSFSIFSFLLIISLSFYAFSQNDPLDKIVSLIKSSDVKALSNHFDSVVKVSLPDKEKNYTNKQAGDILESFFKVHPPSNFSILHKGRSNKDAQYGIGNYSSGNKSFRMYVYLKNGSSSLVIKEIRIEEQ